MHNERLEALGYDKKLSDWLYHFCHNPRTLLHLCVMNIRKHYGPRLFNFVDTLSAENFLPTKLIEMILFKDLSMYTELP